MKWKPISCAILLALILQAVPVMAATGTAEVSGTVTLVTYDISVSNIGYHSATISWKTNGNATSWVFYDTVSHNSIVNYAHYTDEDTSLVSEHSIALTGLASDTTYHYRVKSVIPDTEFMGISEDYTFTTLSPPEVVEVAPPPPTIETNLFGEVASFPISEEGEIQETIEATSEDEMLTLAIEEGTIALDIEGEPLETLESAIDETPPDPPEDAHVIGLAYDFGPDGATFEPALTFPWSYDPDVLPEGEAEEDLFIAYYDEDAGEWVELDGVVDTENNLITTSVPHFTTFTIIGVVTPLPPVIPAAFETSSLSISPAEVVIGEEVTIAVLVANTGGEAGSYQVTLVINDLVEATKEVTVRAGLSKEVTFSVTREEAGSYTVAVDGLSGSFAVVAPLIVPAFSVSSLSVLPAEVEPNEAVTITVLAANTGGVSGSYTVVLKIDGVKEAEETVTVAAGESQDVSFSVTREEAGSYTVTVDGLSGSFTVVAPEEEEEEEVPTEPGINWPLIGGIIGGVIVVGLGVFFWMRRRRAY